MDKKRTQLNIHIDPKLLIALKAQAVKEGKTLTALVTERLTQSSVEANEGTLEQRLLRIENQIDLLQNFTFDIDDKKNPIHSIFSDSGAKKYGEIAKQLFDSYRKEKKLSLKEAFEGFARCLANYNSHPELVFAILEGKHVLTGAEMTMAYKNGACGMRSALHEWTNSSLEPLNEAFLNAVKIEKLV